MSEESTQRSDGTTRTATLDSGVDTSLDTVFDVLSHQRRRYTLHFLNKHDDPMALADLADEIAARENDAPITEMSAEEVKRIYLSLYHRHVPKLEAADLVRYNQDSDTVALAADKTQLEQYEGFLSRA